MEEWRRFIEYKAKGGKEEKINGLYLSVDGVGLGLQEDTRGTVSFVKRPINWRNHFECHKMVCHISYSEYK